MEQGMQKTDWILKELKFRKIGKSVYSWVWIENWHVLMGFLRDFRGDGVGGGETPCSGRVTHGVRAQTPGLGGGKRQAEGDL